MNWVKPLARGYRWVRSQDLIVLMLSLCLAGGTWLFFELADEVVEGETRKLDERILMSMRSAGDPADPLGPLWLEQAVRDITALGGMVVLFLLSAAVIGFLGLRRQFSAAGLVLAALLGGVLLNWMLKDFFGRPRPELVPHLHQVSSASFPSGHAMLTAVVYLTLGSLLARLVEGLKLKLYIISVALGVAVLVGISRVYLGVHYPSDVLAGWCVGLSWAIICWLVARRLQRRGQVEQEQ